MRTKVKRTHIFRDGFGDIIVKWTDADGKENATFSGSLREALWLANGIQTNWGN